MHTAPVHIATTSPVDAHRVAAAIVAVLILAVGLAVIPYGSVAFPVMPSFLPAFGSMTFIIDVITTALLFSGARASQDQAHARLGLAYAVSAMTIIPHLLAFPGVFAEKPIIGGSASAVWLWCVWHGGFALCVCRYALAAEPAAPAKVTIALPLAVTALLVLALTVVATSGLPYLPIILVDGNYRRLTSLGIGPVVVLANLVALVLVLRRLGDRTILSTWLGVAMLAATLDVVITLYSGGRFTAGWYVARCLSLATGVVVLIGLLSELTGLFARASEANRQLQKMSMTDGLTQIANRRAFDMTLQSEWRRFGRDQTCLSLLVIDIDFFKGFNDHFGHPAGDACLQKVAAVLAGLVRRSGDTSARFGGEEFVLLLPGTDDHGAQQVADLLHRGIAALDIEHPTSPMGFLTVSVGIATGRASTSFGGAEGLLAKADEALYEAKQTGRNRTCMAQPSRAPVAMTQPAPDVAAA